MARQYAGDVDGRFKISMKDDDGSAITDSERIPCAYMKEQSQDFEVQVFRAGVEP